jgi:hypothetical protein
MKIAKQPLKTKAITIRIPLELHAQLATDAAKQAWTVNAEINHRLRALPVLEQLRNLTEEVARLNAIIEKQKPE